MASPSPSPNGASAQAAAKPASLEMQSPLRHQAPSPSSVDDSRDVSLVVFHTDADGLEGAPAVPSLEVPVGPDSRRASVRRSISISQRAYHHGQDQDYLNEAELEQPQPLSPVSTSRALHAAQLATAASQPKEDAAVAATDQPKKKLAPSKSAAEIQSKYGDIYAVADVDNGLSDELVEAQREKHGFNETIEEQKPLWLVFLSKFYGLTPFMITAAMAIAFGLEEWANGAVIGVLLLVNGLIAFHEDVRARKALAQLVQKMQVMARAKRNGDWMELPARELVPGDLVRIRTGDIGGADIVILNGDVQVDQSALTGESALKSMNRHGVVYAGSVIRRGEANAIVVATAANTFFGQTAKLVQSSKPNPHIDRILNRVVAILMTLVLILIVISLIIMGVRDDDMVDAIPLLLMVIVTALPVALPAMFTVSMALSSQELSRRSVLVTRLNVLGDASMMSILFSDKTGTLSQNHLTVQSVLPSPSVKGVTQLDILLTAALCSRKANNDPTDMAFLEEYERQAAAHEANPDPANLSLYSDFKTSAYEALDFRPFDATVRRTEAHVRMANGTELKVTKGAVATLCGLSGIEPVESNPEWQRIDAIVEANAAKGFRTLGVAKGDENGDIKKPKFTFLGLVALFDPPREDSLAVVKRLRELGIQTKMLTGDAIGVAREMGEQLTIGRNMINLEKEKQKLREYYAKHGKLVLEPMEGETAIDVPAEANGKSANGKGHSNGADEKPLEPAELDARIMEMLLARYNPLEISGFAQIFPSDKHYIVKHTQAKGFVCGMTGDGVNDAPALKQAEVGCAVDDATDVAKGSASALLLDEGLSGVVQIVEIGRQTHRRVAVWVVNKAAKASQHSVFILIMYLILGRFPISSLGVVLLLLLMDFVMISIATDNQQPGDHPEKWDLAQLTRIGLVVGMMGAGQMMALILSAEYHSDYSEGWKETMAWECMYMWGMLSLFSVREKSWFWSSRPSTVMTVIVVIEVLIVWIVCAEGFDGFPGIGWAYSTGILAISLACFVLNDAVKTIYIRAFEKDY